MSQKPKLPWKTVVSCVAVSLIVATLFLLLGGALMVSGILSDAVAVPFALGASFVGVLVGSRAAAKSVPAQKLLFALASAGGVFVVLLIGGLAFAFPLGGQVFGMMLAVSIAGFVGGVMGASAKTKTTKKKR